jgi:AICAR transformylase/IMP cyclohydrolase PurH
MAKFTYKCPEHGEFFTVQEKGGRSAKCPKCEKDSVRVLTTSSTIRVVEVIDNGLMAKSVERLTNIEELIDQRNDLHKKELQGDYQSDRIEEE